MMGEEEQINFFFISSSRVGVCYFIFIIRYDDGILYLYDDGIFTLEF